MSDFSVLFSLFTSLNLNFSLSNDKSRQESEQIFINKTLAYCVEKKLTRLMIHFIKHVTLKASSHKICKRNRKVKIINGSME